MRHPAARLVYGSQSCRSGAEREIKFLVKGRRIHRIETAKFFECLCRNEEARAGYAIHSTPVGIRPVAGISFSADRAAPTVRKNPPARVLDRSIHVQQHRADNCRAWRFFGGLHEGAQPSRADDGVAIQKTKVSTSGFGRPCVACEQEPEVLSVGDLDQSFTIRDRAQYGL